MTDEGIIGYREYSESFESKGVTSVIEFLATLVKGSDSFAHDVISSRLYACSRLARGGINAQAIGAIENAFSDMKGKAFNVCRCVYY
jgi:L-alanine-DL-glutamate epimerase-like enolase superfamily enzyme